MGLKFNLRLVNYAITDFYTKSIALALESHRARRKRLAEKDLKRFCRVIFVCAVGLEKLCKRFLL